ncbi:gamma-glutamyl phosphate reductase [Bombella intestini]|uniref:Gamma-glutamyl phosphate reductase n=1 Tax=Bombella intestini TaxID=1539051 RepID=A0A1S8GPS3_9PROT|nr:glutamate-5-semialdehyde dehydrogenase [Bombella intestini]OOL18396.1 gamma-glutamyl phosphate reductase [Bombella intestini]
MPTNKQNEGQCPPMHGLARRARVASGILSVCPAEQRTAALHHVAIGLRNETEALLAANRRDLEQANLSPFFRERLTLTAERLEGVACSVDALAGMEDPVGQVLAVWQQPNGLKLHRVATPLGVLGMIHEGRPTVGVDAATLAIRSGNVLLLRGGPESFHSTRALHRVIQQGLARAGLPEDVVLMVPDAGPAHVEDMLHAVGLIDVIVVRGGRALVEHVQAEARVPVLAHAAGMCHSYVHQAADLELARKVVRNAKLRRPGICGATETLLIDAAIAPSFLPNIVADLTAEGCTFRADEAARAILPELPAAIEDDFATEWLDKVLNISVVEGVDAALAHVARFSSRHTEAILTEDEAVAQYFMQRVPSAIVMWNTSTQFSDGGEFGLGGEIGIMSGRMLPRGPVGPAQLMTYRYEVHGKGQLRP